LPPGVTSGFSPGSCGVVDMMRPFLSIGGLGGRRVDLARRGRGLLPRERDRIVHTDADGAGTWGLLEAALRVGLDGCGGYGASSRMPSTERDWRREGCRSPRESPGSTRVLGFSPSGSSRSVWSSSETSPSSPREARGMTMPRRLGCRRGTAFGERYVAAPLSGAACRQAFVPPPHPPN
jgi:hypothetical protein